jgi:hypothetical protein
MSLRRILRAICVSAVVTISIPAGGQGWSEPSYAGEPPQNLIIDPVPGVQKDDSQLTVVSAKPDDNASIVDTAIKKKKTFWDNKVFHPTQWFSKKK